MRVLFVIQDFESKRFKDSAGNIEFYSPMLQSGLITEHKLLNFGIGQVDHDSHVIKRLKELKHLLNDDEVIVYGAGVHTARYLKEFTEFNVVALADKDVKLQQGCRFGHLVISPEEIGNYATNIIISSKAWEDSIVMDLRSRYGSKVNIYTLYDENDNYDLLKENASNQLRTEVAAFLPDLIAYSSAHAEDRLPGNLFMSLKETYPSLKFVNILWDYDEQAYGNSYLAQERDFLTYSDCVIENSCFSRIERMKKSKAPYEQHPNTEKIFFHPTIFSETLFHPQDVEKDIDIAIFGNPAGNRREWISFLQSVFGDRFHHIGGGENVHGYIPVEEYATMLRRSKIVVNTQSFSFAPQCKGKVREALGVGAFLLEEDNEETRAFVKADNALVYFKGEDDLVAKIGYYLEHKDEREVIAQNGHRWLRENYSAKKWTETLFNFIGF
ncbi:glycosyltransferase family protein [Curvivirga sp.]|uniref:glycosyltransferase family protein n=1 Tax=Curvivirga sp. TaxID=2856848 RepID=UPI003B5BB87E